MPRLNFYKGFLFIHTVTDLYYRKTISQFKRDTFETLKNIDFN